MLWSSRAKWSLSVLSIGARASTAATNLLAACQSRRADNGADEVALAVEHHDRLLEAIFGITGIEQAPLLAAIAEPQVLSTAVMPELSVAVDLRPRRRTAPHTIRWRAARAVCR
jgi:hypothetical protein